MFFDGDQVKDYEFKELKSGIYDVCIEEIGLKDSREGIGKYIRVVFSITKGEFENKKIFLNFFMKHEKEDISLRGKSDFKKILLATIGRPQLRSEMELNLLCDKFLKIEIVIKKKQDGTMSTYFKNCFKLNDKKPNDSLDVIDHAF